MDWNFLHSGRSLHVAAVSTTSGFTFHVLEAEQANGGLRSLNERLKAAVLVTRPRPQRCWDHLVADRRRHLLLLPVERRAEFAIRR